MKEKATPLEKEKSLERERGLGLAMVVVLLAIPLVHLVLAWVKALVFLIRLVFGSPPRLLVGLAEDFLILQAHW